MNVGIYSFSVADMEIPSPRIGAIRAIYSTTSNPSGLISFLTEKNPSFILSSRETFCPVTRFLLRTILELRSNATYMKSDTSPKISISIPCHVVKRNFQSPEVTATLPLLLSNAWNNLPSRNNQMQIIAFVTI